MQHLNTQNVITGEGYNFLGTHFWRGQDFWAVNLRGGKIFGPSLLTLLTCPTFSSIFFYNYLFNCVNYLNMQTVVLFLGQEVERINIKSSEV